MFVIHSKFARWADSRTAIKLSMGWPPAGHRVKGYGKP
jgi:hypothetical protein